MNRRPPHLLPGQSDARQAQLLAESPLESWHEEVANGGVFSADKLAALFLVLGLFFSQLGLIGTPAAHAATAPSIVASTLVDDRPGNVTSIDISNNGAAEDDLMIVHIVRDNTDNAVPPAGWTLLRRDALTFTYQAIYWKIAGPSEPAAYSWSFTNADSDTVIWSARIDGVDTSTPIGANDVTTTTGDVDIHAPSVAATTTDSLLLTLYSGDTGNDGYSPHAGMAEQADLRRVFVALYAASETITSTSPTGTRTATADNPVSHDSVGVSLIVNPAPAPTHSISGTVFEDIAGDVLNDGAIGDVNNPGAVGVTVRLYDGGSVLTDTQTTDAAGGYTFTGLPDDTYQVVVDSRTIPSAQDPTAAAGDIWAEQTYGPIGGICADGTGAATSNLAAGPCYGGFSGALSDDATANKKHQAVFTLSGADVSNVDFGFSFNVIVTTRGGDNTDDDGSANRTVQGSLRQFIQNANAISGTNAMRFVPVVPVNGGTWWEIVVSSALPSITDAGATIDGTAYQLTDGTSVRDTNGGFLGANAAGGVAVGVDNVGLPQVEAPELEIQGDQTIPSPAQTGFVIQANSTTVRRLAIYGFGDHSTAGTDANIQVGPSGGPTFDAIVVEQNVIGSGAGGFVDPGLAARTDGNNIHVTDAISGGPGQENRVRDNLIGFAYSNGVMIITNTGGWLVTGNEIRAAGLDNASGPYMDTLAFEGTTSSGHSAVGNFITQTDGPGIDTWRSPGSNTIENNDLVQNGSGGSETAGLRIFGTGSSVSKNVITNNTGPGVIVVGERPVTVPTWTAATGNRISQNQFGTNSGIAIDLVESSDLQTPHGQGDGVTLTPGTDATTGNNGIDAPVVSTATTATVSGTVCSGCEVEVYRAVAGAGDNSGGTDYGEGVEYLGVAIADGSGDWTLSGITGLLVGDEISAIAIDGPSNTSEFAANVPATLATGPGGVTADLGLWLRADIGVTTSGADVVSWADQSVNGNNATQGSVGQQPDLVASAVNGNPIVDFDGTDDVIGGTAGASSHSYYAVVVPDATISSASPAQNIFAFDCAACVSDTAFMAFGNTTGTFPDEIVTHGHGGSAAWRVSQTGAATYPSGVPVILASRSNAALDGTDIYADGLEVDNAVNGSFISTTDEAYNVAAANPNSPWPGEYLDGKIAEVISYSSRATDAEHQQIQSYLAIKYGLTLDQSAAYDYVASDGTVIWNATANAAYNNDIAGIGQDDATVLDQTASRSVNSDSIVSISNASSQGVGDFLVWGNDDGATTWTTTGSPVGERLQRTWRVYETGELGSTTVSFDVGTLSPQGSAAADFHLLIDADADFSSGATDVVASSYAAGVATFTGVAIADGDHLTIASTCADSDGDGLCDREEDANTDADDDPATNPGPDTDGDLTPNYLDADDDDDGALTASENADPNGDGDPRDAVDSDRDAQPDYLDLPTVAASGDVAGEQVISATQGGLAPALGVSDHFGRAIAPIGDLDGDGVNDIAVGAPNDDDGSSDRGAVYILFMNGNGTVKGQQKISDADGGFTAILDNADEFGISVTGLGDLDGDLVPDIAVGAHQDDDGLNGNGGAVYVLFMNTNGTVKSYQKISETEGGLGVLFGANDRFGGAVANIGDLDGDGLNDIVVGAKDDDDGVPNAGAVYVVFLNGDGTVKGQQKISQTVGGLAGAPLGGSDGFGIGVAGLGDVDGDGNGDVAVGSYWDDDGGTNHGAAYVLFLDTDGTVTGQQKISNTQGNFTGVLQSNDEFGTAVGAAGDIDADGVPDLIVGTPKDDDGNSLSGAAYVLFLNANGTVKSHQKISNSEGGLGVTINTSDQFGFAAAGVGDLDGDGTIGVAVGAFGDDDGFVDSGSVYILNLGTPNGPPTAVPGGPYSTDEGEDLILDGSGSTDPDTDPLTYNWDIDNDGQYDDATGPNPTVPWLTLVGLGFDDDGGPYPVGLEVDDGNGNTDTATVNWTIANTPPTITITGSGTIGAGSVYTANLSVSDPGDDTVTEWTINWGDGNIQTIPGNPVSATHQYANPGSYNITAAVLDEDSPPNLPWHNGRMVVPGLFANEQLFLLEATTGTVGPNLAASSGQGWAINATIGPDGLAYVGDYTGDSIRRYDPVNETDLGIWASGGGLDGPAGMQFGPDGHLYVSSNFSDEILEYAPDGTLLGVFATVGGLDEPDDLTFGPDGHLYVTSFHTDQVLKYNGRDGHPMGEFAAGPEMEEPSELTFGPNGKLYVTSVVNDQVVRYNADGSLDTIFASESGTGLNEPRGAVFGPDGHLYVGGRNRIVRYDGSSGALIDVYLTSGSINGPSQSAFIPAHNVSALPLIVNSTGDASDNNPGDGVCYTGDVNSETNPECTLRAAIEEANAFAGTDTINFAMPATETGHSGGVWTLSPGADYGQLIETVIIDGTTQTGWTTTPVVELDGNGAVSDGFRIAADDVEIHGLAISRFPGDGIEIAAGAADVVIAANHIGLDATGLVDRGNVGRGIDLGAGSGPTRVGGGEVTHRNVISGNGDDGIIIWGSDANVVLNNFIGTDVTGNLAIANAADGIALGSTSASNVIGQVGDVNIISGNANDGVENDATGANNIIYYNLIGIGADGTSAVPNGRHGVVIYDGANNTWVYQNLIAGNTGSGVIIDGNGNAATSANNVIGNYIGLDLASNPRPNGSHGIHIFGGATANVVGGTVAAYRNIISGNGVDGIRIDGSATSGNRIENNHIGTNIAGDAAVPNGNNGVFIVGAPSNTIGGLTPDHRNVISGNGNNGVLLDAATATGNQIQGNYVGLNAAGDAAIPNADEGVDLSDSPGNVVGGDSVNHRNVISGNGQDGVLLIGAGSTGNFVAGNYIGTNAAGDASVANGRAGVYVDNAASNNDIGGPTSDWGNVISGNTEDGIYLTDIGTDLNRIKHNYIGTNAAGNAAVPNGDRGVQVESGASFNRIGDIGQGNVISGNTGDGIIIADWLSLGTSDNNIIENLIGVAADGTTPLGNGANGVHIDPVADTLIGTNTIAHNAWDGVLLEPTSLTGNSIVGNSIYSNGQLGIDLGNDGITSNDPGDGDPGPNNLLNYPEITSAVAVGGNITIQFDLDVPPGDYRIEFFDNSIADPSGNGEGETYVDSFDVMAHPGGSAGYSTSIPGAAYDIITATTTEQVAAPYGSSSEFSVAFVATAGTMMVNSTGDGGDTVVGDGLCDTGGLNSAGDPECTLRAAIEEANFDVGADDIEFDIPVSDANHAAGIWTIAPGSQYENLDTTMSINGATQPGWAGDPVIQIDGSADLTSSAGLNVFSSNSEIRGLILHSFPDEGIESDGSLGGGDNNTFAGNWVGIDASGAAAPNGGFGILLTDGAANNTVGGPNPEDANVVGSNAVGGIGVWLLGTDNNRVYGNFVGVLNDGVTPVPNSGHGIDIDDQAAGNEIGGTTATANTIRSNTGDGVYLSASAGSGNSILRNVIAANSGLGINLDDPADPASGVTPNDLGDGDGGPNGLLNYPLIDSAVIAPPWITVNYTIDAPPADYVVEFFSNPSGADPSGNGEGDAFEYRDPISHPGGAQSYVAVFSGFITDELTATLTEDLSGSFGSTSEFSAVAPVTAGTLVVNSTGNGSDAAPGNGACDTGGTNSEGDDECTLNAAIQEANALGGTNEIHFAIPDSDAGYQNLGAGSSYWKIRPAGSIDPLTADDTTIDATTQTSYAVGQGFFVNDLGPEIELDGSLAGGNGLAIQGSNNETRGFVINRFATGIAVLSGDGNVIAGNFIGPDPTGAAGQVGNTIEGVEVDGATNTVIGGSAVADRNVISGNNQRGIALDVDNPGTAGTQVLGNYIGTNAAGDAALLYNATDVQEIGVYVLNNPDTVVGTAADGNVISGNSWFGIYGWGPLATGTTIQGNIIGLDATGSSPVPNATDLGGARAGVSLSSIPGALIGGDVAGQGNVIAENAEYGIVLYAAAATSTTMIGNQIYSNADLGIDLNGDGVSVNAPGDPLNYPEITSATESGGTVTVDFDLDVPLGNYRIEFFVNPSGGDPSGYGEGETLVHSYNVVGHPGGAASYGTSFAGTAGDIITATTTEGTAAPYGSTSEFSAAVTVTFLDITPPVITLVGANPQVIEVGSPYVELGATALDDVDGDITGSIVIDASAVNTAALGSYLVTYNVSDSAGNPAIEVTRTVDVVDTTAPVLTLLGANPQTIEVGSPYVELGATATDNYDGDLTGSIVINSSAVNTAVVGTYVVTYDVVDSSGNPASGFRTVDVVDTTAPVITLVGANPQTIEAGSPYVELGATAWDNYDGDITGSIVIDASGVDTSTVGSYSVTYDVTDSQGNPAVQVVRTVDVVDTTAPVITLVGANPQMIEVGSPYVELGAAAWDAGDGDLTGSIVIDATAVNTAVLGSYPVTYDVTDSQGNPAVQMVRTVDVVDTTAPVLTLLGANPQTIEVGSPYVELGATATDNYDGDLTGSIVINSSAVNTAVVGTYVVTYDVVDSSGNPASGFRTVDVVDTTAPVITLVGANPQTIEAGSPYVELGATAWDNYDGDITGSIVIDASGVDTSTVGSYSVTYDVTDSQGNPAVQVVRTVDVVDTTAPVITLVGANPQMIEVGSPYVELGAAAWDAGDGDLTGSIVIDATAVNTAVLGSYPVTYDVTDSQGNPAVQVVRTVDVVDTTAPVITLVGANPQTIEVGSPYVELGATAFDVGDGDLTGSIVIDATAVNTAVVGSYPVTYDVTDSQGNPAIQVVRTVDVVDTTAPVITLVGANPQTIEAGSPYVELGATASDNYDGDLTGSIVIDASAVDTGVVGSYPVTYDVTDSQGNPAVQVIRTVDVVDTTAPVITLVGANPQTINVMSPYVELGATALDNHDGDITGAIVIDASAVDTTVVGSYPVTYDVTDSQGNPAIQVIRTVDVVNVAPTLGAIANQTVDELTLATFTATASDPDPTDGLTFGLSGEPSGASIDPVSGVFTWTPTEAQGPNSYTFDVVVTDSGAPPLADSLTITITVSEVNLQPTLNPIPPQTVDEQTVMSFVATAGDPDVPANGLTFILSGAPAGAAIDPATGVFTWIPAEDQGPGIYSFDVQVSDNGAPVLSDTQPVTITVNEVNTAPVVTDPGPQTDAEADTVSLPIAASDGDVPANVLTYSAAGLPDGLSIDPVSGLISGTIDYSANAGSPFSVTVAATDDGTPTRTGQTTFVWTVNDTNRPPVAVDDVAVVDEDTPVTIDVVANDSDPDGDAPFVSGFGGASHGTVSLVGPNLVYVPDPNYNGSDTFGYTLSDGRGGFAGATVLVSVTPVNDAPSLSAVTQLYVDEGNLATFVASASDLEGDVVTFSLQGEPTGATIDPSSGTFTWIPAENQGPGSYTFAVRGTDNGAPPASASRSVQIHVAEVNRAPIVTNPGTLVHAENQSVSATITGTDPDIPAGSLTYSAVGLPPGLAIDPLSGEVSGLVPFDASAGSPYAVTVTATDDGGPALSGSTTFNWVITNTNRPPAAFDITVFADAGVPVSFVLNGTDPDGDVLSFAIAGPPSQGILSGGPRLYDYTPAITAGGTDVFTFVVSDGALQATGTVTVFITPNLPPEGGSDEYTVRDQGVLVVEPPGVLANDSDPEGRPISAIVDTQPAHGSLQLRPDGSFVYRHLGSVADVDLFSYRIDDGMQLSAPISVVINVEENVAPVAVADEVVTNEDTAVLVRALDNDYDPNNETVVVSDVIELQEGTVSWSIDGVFRYTPPPNWYGSDVIRYEITDGELVASAIITIEVLPVNDPPQAFEAELTGDSGEMMLIDLSPYATDADGDALDFLLESPPTSPVGKVGAATFELDLDGVIADLAPLTFIVSDPSGARDASSLMLRVRIPAELVGIPSLVADDIGRGEDPDGGIAGGTPTNGGPMVTGLRLMVGSVLDTFRAFRFPMLGLIVVLLASLWLGLSRRFAFSATPTLLPAGNRRKVDIVMAPSSAGVPVRNEPGSHQSVIHRFAADEIDVIATGASSMLRSEVWVEVETPEGDGWVNSEFLTEQQQAAAFSADDRPGRLVRLFVEALYRSDDLLPMTGGHDLHVARYGPPVRFASGALPRLLSGASVYWWWGPEGDTPKHQGTFAETVGESFSQAFRNRAAHPFEPTFPIPLEFRNMHSLVVGNDRHGEGWRVFFRFEDGEPLVGGLMREAAPNPAAMHGRNELEWA